jgi:hypothetical protein
MNKYFHKEIINLIKMQIKSALFCLATVLVVFTSAGPVDSLTDSNPVSKGDVKKPLGLVDVRTTIKSLKKIPDSLKTAVKLVDADKFKDAL